MRGLSLVAASGGHSSWRCAGLSLSRPLLLRSTRSRRAGSAVVAHGPSCSAACGIFPDQGSNPCTPHRQADSQPLRHQGSPGLRNFDSSGAIPTHLSMVGRPGAILPVDTGEVMMGKRDVLPVRGLKLMRLLDKCINAQ